MTNQELQAKICNIIKENISFYIGFKNEHIEAFCSIYPLIYEDVCNNALDLDNKTELLKYFKI